MRHRFLRAGALLAVTLVTAVAMATAGGAAGENALSKKEKRQGNRIWIEHGEQASDADKLDGIDSSGFLATDDQMVLAGFRTHRPTPTAVELDRWFNNVNGLAPSFSATSTGFYQLQFGFELGDTFPTCTVDNRYVDTRNAVCSVVPSGQVLNVEIEDPNTTEQEAEVFVVIFG